jgi:hypothetical protein
LVGCVAQTRRVRIPLHIPADREKVIVILDGKRLESALIQMAVSRSVIMRMMALGVRQAQPLAERSCLFSANEESVRYEFEK